MTYLSAGLNLYSADELSYSFFISSYNNKSIIINDLSSSLNYQSYIQLQSINLTIKLFNHCHFTIPDTHYSIMCILSVLITFRLKNIFTKIVATDCFVTGI